MTAEAPLARHSGRGAGGEGINIDGASYPIIVENLPLKDSLIPLPRSKGAGREARG